MSIDPYDDNNVVDAKSCFPNADSGERNTGARARDNLMLGTDEMVVQLARHGSELVDKLKAILGIADGEWSIPTTVQPEWPEEASDVFSQYRRVQSEIGLRNSRRCSMQLTAFKTFVDGDDDMPPDLAVWWWNRY